MTQFMPTKPYFQMSANECAELQAEQAELVKVADDPQSDWVTRERAAARLREVRRSLMIGQMAGRRAQPAESVVGNVAYQSPTHFIVCAPGYRAITERPDGKGAILILADDGAANA